MEFSLSLPTKSVQPPSSFLTGAGTPCKLVIFCHKSELGEERWGHGDRVPSTLQPGPVEEPKPRPWLSSDEAWAQARREVEERRKQKLAADLEKAEIARRQLERNTSQAVREAKTKLLDKVLEIID